MIVAAAAVSDLYRTLNVSRDASADEIKAAYRRLAHRHHPDKNPGSKRAEEAFKRVGAAYEVLSDPARRAAYDKSGTASPIVICSRSASYQVEALHCAGDVADVYRARSSADGATVALKVARSPADNDLLEREWRVIKSLHPPGNEAEEGARRYFPRAIESFKIDDGRRRQVNVLGWLDNFHTLEEVRAAYPAGVQMEHGVWMLNRLLEAITWSAHEGLVHGGIVPAHAVVYEAGRARDLYNHGAKLIGWCCSVKVGERVPAISKKWRAFYAPEILDKRPVSIATDIYMAVRCIQYVLGGSIDKPDEVPGTVPQYLRNWLRGCALASASARPQDPWELHEELKEHMAKHYGPKKYVPFNMPAR